MQIMVRCRRSHELEQCFVQVDTEILWIQLLLGRLSNVNNMVLVL